jgi:hypothetical protein
MLFDPKWVWVSNGQAGGSEENSLGLSLENVAGR